METRCRGAGCGSSSHRRRHLCCSDGESMKGVGVPDGMSGSSTNNDAGRWARRLSGVGVPDGISRSSTNNDAGRWARRLKTTEGTVLISVLWVILLLSLVSFSLASTVRMEVASAQQSFDS